MRRPIPGFEGFYEADSDGGIISVRTGERLKPSLNEQGYEKVSLWANNRKHNCRVHRLVLIAFLGQPPEGQQAAHINNIRTDNRIDNLKWVTPKENNSHKILHGTAQRGERGTLAKLTDDGVISLIRDKQTMTWRQICKKYAVSRTSAQRAYFGKTWAHIDRQSIVGGEAKP